MERFAAHGKQALKGPRQAELRTFTDRLCGSANFVSKLNAPTPYLRFRIPGSIMDQHSEHVLRVGQDPDGHWIVQEAGGQLEGLFRTREAAIRFAMSECRAFPGARMVLATTPLHSILSH